MPQSPSELKESILRLRSRISKGRETIEEVSSNLTGLAVGGVLGYGSGVLDQRYGKEIAAGVKQHRLGNVPTTLLATGAGVAVTLLGGFGKMSHIGWDATKSAFTSYSNTMGRAAAVALEEKAGKSSETADPPAAKKTGTAG
jgi:hypothetical protein